MYIYELISPAGSDYSETFTWPEKVLAYYTSREAVERHVEDSELRNLEVYKVEVRAMYNPTDPEPERNKVYGSYRAVSGKYMRGWLDKPDADVLS